MSWRSVYVKMRPDEVEALARLAHDQRRRPSDQAAWLLAEALKQARRDTGPKVIDGRPVEAGAAP